MRIASILILICGLLLSCKQPVRNKELTFSGYYENIHKSELNKASLSYIPTTMVPNISTTHNQGTQKVQYEKPWKYPLHVPTVITKIFSENGQKQYRTYFNDTLHQLPIISLHIDSLDWFDDSSGIYVPGIHCDPTNSVWTGNYHQKGKAWEKTAFLEYFENYQLQFAQKVGTRIHGLKAGSAPQKSLRLYARKKYGNKYLQHPFFGVNKLKRMIIRTPFSAHKAMLFTDPLIHSIAQNTHLDRMANQAVVMYVNGEYWGVYYLRERMDEKYILNHYGFKASQIDFQNWKAFAASILKIESLNMKDTSDYRTVNSIIDIDNFIDYIIIQTFFRNKDWLVNNNNTVFWRPKDGKWRLLLIDLDAGFQREDQDMFAFMKANSKSMVSRIFFKLMESPTFQASFKNRYNYLLHHHLSSDNIMEKIAMFKTELYSEMSRQSNRWRHPSKSSDWLNNVDEMISFAQKRSQIVSDQIQSHFK